MEDNNTHTATTKDPAAPTATTFLATIEPAAFASAYSAVSLAASSDTSRAALCSVAVETLENGSVRLFATDSYRLHVATIAAEHVETFGLPVGASVRFTASSLKASEVRRLAKTANPRGCTNGRIRLQCATFVNDYRDSLSSSEPVNVAALDALGSVVASIGAANATYHAFPDCDRLLERPTNAEPSLPAVNPVYLGDVAKAATFVGGNLVWEVAAELKPNFFTASADGVDLVALVMPVRVG